MPTKFKGKNSKRLDHKSFVSIKEMCAAIIVRDAVDSLFSFRQPRLSVLQLTVLLPQRLLVTMMMKSVLVCLGAVLVLSKGLFAVDASMVDTRTPLRRVPTGRQAGSWLVVDMLPSDAPPSAEVAPSQIINNSDLSSDMPSDLPSDIPSDEPSAAPTASPAMIDTGFVVVVDMPTSFTIDYASDLPSDTPSDLPSEMPSNEPSPGSTTTTTTTSTMTTDSPTFFPSDIPSDAPSDMPTHFPSDSPSDAPSVVMVPSILRIRRRRQLLTSKEFASQDLKMESIE
jgi:hypothetical protein